MSDSIVALTRAMEFEREGKKFYAVAIEKTKSDMARSIFDTLMQQEQQHLEYLTNLYDVMQATDAWPAETTVNVEADFKLIFKEASANIDKNIKVSTDEIEALDYAMKMELRGRDMYIELSGKATDPREKELYATLADWEKGHAEYCEDYLNFFTDNGMRTEE